MKIAVCLSGNYRTFEYCKPYIENFFDGFATDWFVHAWPEDYPAFKDSTAIQVCADALPADHSELERRSLQRFQEHCFVRLIPMYWGISQAIALVDERQYDLIVRIRPDVIAHQKFQSALPYLQPDTLGFAYHMQSNMAAWQPPRAPAGLDPQAPSGYNDLLFYGDARTMKRFEKAYDWIGDFIDSPQATHFTASQLLHYFVHQKIGAKATRGPLSLYLIGPEQAKQPVQAYRKIDRSVPRKVADLAYIREKFPDLAEAMARPIAYTPAQAWFEKCWSWREDDPSLLAGYNA
jgi:hypothetical protein